MRSGIRFGILALLVLGHALAAADGPGERRNSTPDRSQPSPWDNDVLLYRSASGARPVLLHTFERAGVPSLVRLGDGRLLAAFQHFPQDDERRFDHVAVSFSTDDGRTWSKPEPIVVAGMEAGLARPFDPTLVPLPDGRIRLYFTSNRSPDFRRSIPAIYSAVATDGIHYDFEPGVRFAIDGRIVIDCSVALHDGVFHLVVPDNGAADDFMAGQRQGRPPSGGNGYHAVSKDGLAFERVADVKLPDTRNHWLGALHSRDGKLYFFGSGPGPWPVASTDGTSWQALATSVNVPGADPGAVKQNATDWLLIVTGPPRPGTPGAQRRIDSGR